MLDQGIPPTRVPKLLQRLADAVETWPRFPPPADMGSLTICDVALSDSIEEHISTVREWAGLVWQAWSQYHDEVADLVSHHLK